MSYSLLWLCGGGPDRPAEHSGLGFQRTSLPWGRGDNGHPDLSQRSLAAAASVSVTNSSQPPPPPPSGLQLSWLLNKPWVVQLQPSQLRSAHQGPLSPSEAASSAARKGHHPHPCTPCRRVGHREKVARLSFISVRDVPWLHPSLLVLHQGICFWCLSLTFFPCTSGTAFLGCVTPLGFCEK